MQSTSYQGFPVVRSDEDRTIIGLVNKVELRYALGASRICLAHRGLADRWYRSSNADTASITKRYLHF